MIRMKAICCNCDNWCPEDGYCTWHAEEREYNDTCGDFVWPEQEDPEFDAKFAEWDKTSA